MTVTEAVKLSGLTPSADYTGVETTDDFLLDEDSDLMELHPGDNVLTADAASGREGLQASISFYPLAVGILPEVMK